jgi:hypothetical protein
VSLDGRALGQVGQSVERDVRPVTTIRVLKIGGNGAGGLDRYCSGSRLEKFIGKVGVVNHTAWIISAVFISVGSPFEVPRPETMTEAYSTRLPTRNDVSRKWASIKAASTSSDSEISRMVSEPS